MTDFSTEVRARLAAATVPGPGEDQAARAVRGVLRARDRRRQRLAVSAVAAVVLAGGGVTAIMRTSAAPDVSTPASNVLSESSSWPQRGQFTGDTRLIDSSLEAWSRAFPNDRAANPAVLFAGSAGGSHGGLMTVVVVLRGTDENGRTVVAFATTPLEDALPSYGAKVTIRARQVLDKPLDSVPVVGFVTTKPLDGEQFDSSFAFALTAAGVSDARIVSSIDDGPATPMVDGAFSVVLRQGAGRWNTAALLRGRGTFELASGVTDVVARDVKVVKSDNKLMIDGQAAVGDLVITGSGVVGIVAAGGVIDTNLDRLNELQAVDGTFDGTKYLPEPGKNPADGSSLVLDHFGSALVKISVGTIHREAGTWQVTRSVPIPDGVEGAMVISR
ncbi:hypothetical protein SAMN05421504_10216 [Amycolatopsis xylanica]|uniref:Uncharacterized protein n=1 Tax=Amycolatopsis xylanica TaxID=589385 RepID=A0A1H2Y4N9_9PSEU|nr:hypothetical protein [Amycolatopsis xylanica]SDX00097.1 hypothetical protein SAMN05421504_10216 [Amycolatopsis xylanica]